MNPLAAPAAPLDADELHRLDAWWRAANYLSVGQIYLLDNPLLREPLRIEHVKPRLLGHWGTSPGLNFIYAHLNRVIRRDDLDMIYICGPGHGGPSLVANVWLEGTYTEFYPDVTTDAEGMRRLFRQFSFPGGIPSHAAPETPGSIHEGGELGYALSHAYGAAFDNPELIVACVIGDGEAETGPLASAWHSNKFLNPVRDGTVLPILHLNGYKIANPALLARLPREELEALLTGYGHRPYFVEGDQPAAMHRQMAATLDAVLAELRAIRDAARGPAGAVRPRWPMIVLRTPKGWTGPKEVDGQPTEGSWRSHQVPLADLARRPERLGQLEAWLRSYRPEELFDAGGAPVAGLRALAPEGPRRMGANPHANGGVLLRDLRLPDFRDYAVPVDRPGAVQAEATRVMGTLMRDVMRLNADHRNFRVVSPDELTSNRWGALFEVTDRAWMAETLPGDDHLSPEGRVMEILSEHTCQGWLEGYLLTGRHGFFSCYEAFIHLVDSMFNQHAKWLKVAGHEIPWRRPIASLNYLLTSHVWRQDHNGFSHQDPGFIDHVVNKKADVIRVYLPPDANTLLVVTDTCLRSRNLVNVIVAGKQPQEVWLTMDHGDPALRDRHRHLGMGEQRSRRRAGRGAGLRRRRAGAGDAGRGGAAARVGAAVARARGERRRPDDAAAGRGASARTVEPRLRRAVHDRPADPLRLPRLPVADPSTDLPAHQPPEPARARLQGRRHDYHAVRHGGAQRSRPLPPGRRRRRPRPRPGAGARLSEAARARQAGRAPRVHRASRHRPARGGRLALAGLIGHGKPTRSMNAAPARSGEAGGAGAPQSSPAYSSACVRSTPTDRNPSTASPANSTTSQTPCELRRKPSTRRVSGSTSMDSASAGMRRSIANWSPRSYPAVEAESASTIRVGSVPIGCDARSAALHETITSG
jgi:xylulose-5-phosphate/fructose-6-phosphate phosphoketolase